MKTYLFSGLFISLLTLAGCNVPYRIDVDQGNIITPAEVSQLQLGMSKDEVQLVLGGSLLNDIFHKDRWDYVQYYKNGRTQEVQEGLVSLLFSNGLLTEVKAERLTELKTEPVNYER